MRTDAAIQDEAIEPAVGVAEPWWDDASCNTGTAGLTQLFFSEELQDISKAKRICASCPVLEDCLSGAIQRREPWGVWGGQLFLNGRVLASKRARGRPPKVARPEDQFFEVPIPIRLEATVQRHRASVA